MRLYLDDDSASRHLIRVLRQAGHDVESPQDAQIQGQPDPVHFTHCVRVGRILVTGNHRDFELLHLLIHQAGGQHPGVFAIRKDNSPRDMTPSQIERAIDRLAATGATVANHFLVLNHWR